MPATKRTLPSGLVQVRTPGGVKAKGTTPAKAEGQRRLLEGIEHGWRPTGGNVKKGGAKRRTQRELTHEIARPVPYRAPKPSVRLEGHHAKTVANVRPGKTVSMRVTGRMMEGGIDEFTGRHHARIQVHRVSVEPRKEKVKGSGSRLGDGSHQKG